MQRRDFLTGILGVVAGTVAGLSASGEAEAQIIRRRMRRRRIRRRIRRHVVVRSVFGRPFWVVPVGMAIGWELAHGNRVVVVKETRYVEREGQRIEVAVVQDDQGKTEEVEILRENTPENRNNQKGSILPEGDKATPGVDDEVEEEVAE